MRTRLTLIGLFVAAAGATASAQQTQDLSRATLEELMKIEITSVSRHPQRASDVAASVFVITRDDIRRSGLTTIPELLRLAPGVQVSRLNENRWAVSVRGFNDLYSNKLLVLIDGRSIYNRAFSGVFWDAELVPVEDIDRVEVIRGPGTSMWGANAVNGVINIVTRTTEDTEGGRLRVGAASNGGVSGYASWGAAAGDTRYRLYTQWADAGHSVTPAGDSAGDTWTTRIAGFRMDGGGDDTSFSLHGDIGSSAARSLWSARTDASPVDPGYSRAVGTTNFGNIMAQWTRTASSGGVLQLQSFVTARSDDAVGEREYTADAGVQYHTRRGRHDAVFGGEVRVDGERVAGSFIYSLNPARAHDTLAAVFAQDEVRLGQRLTMTAGAKLEYDRATGAGVLPTIRAVYALPRGQRVWAALSRALRRPSLSDRFLVTNYGAFPAEDGTPVLLRLVGNPAYQTEEATSVEAGYRVDIGKTASLDAVAFTTEYDRLPTVEPLPVSFETTPAPAHLVATSQFRQLLEARTRGLEVSGRAEPVKGWHVDGSFSLFHLTPRVDAASLDPFAASADGNAPRRQWQLHASAPLGTRAEVSAGVFSVGRLEMLQIPAYTRVDARIQVALTSRLTLAISGENLTNRAHAEFSGLFDGLASTFIQRQARAQTTWRF
jgi:iron complex outermembrane receptor protein